MTDVTTYVGIDAHHRELHVARLIGHGPTPETWVVANELWAVDRLRRKLEREARGRIEMCHEAGPCGYVPLGYSDLK